MALRRIFWALGLVLVLSITVGAQQWDWVERFSGHGAVGWSVGVDDAHDVYVAGTFTGTNQIGAHRISSEFGDNVFIAKFSSLGVPLWAVTAAGAFSKLLVASNGSVFVCGNLAFRDSLNSVTNVSLARLDAGNLVWAEPLGPGVANASSMAFGPDETIYVLAATNQAVVSRYTQNGELLGAFGVPGELMSARGIAVGPGEEIYVAARRRSPNPSTFTTMDFISRISSSGDLLWTWSAGFSDSYYKRHIQAIAATPDGGVVPAGYSSYPLPQQSAWVAKLSVSGTQEWVRGVSTYGKRFFSAEAVAVDARGNIHVTGTSHRTYYNEDRLMVLSFSSSGEQLSAEHIASYVNGHRNAGTAIAVDKEGAVLVTGTLQGETIFGTNRLPYAPLNGFVARRSTVLPELVQEQIGNHFALSWPTTAWPFALQQSGDGGSNWSFVSVAPQRDGWRNRTVLPADNGMIFRLFRTNEAPILHAPRIFPLYVPGAPFLNHERVIIPESADYWVSRLGLNFADDDADPLTVAWTNRQTGGPLTNDIRVTKLPGRNDRNIRYPDYYGASVAVDASMFPSGRYAVAVSVSDGPHTVTQNYPEFEVISGEQAVEEFLAALEPVRSIMAGRKAIHLLEAFRRADERERMKLAETRWVHFKRQLGRVTSLSEEQRRTLASAAELLKPLL